MPFKFNPFTTKLDIVEAVSGAVIALAGNSGTATPSGGIINVVGNGVDVTTTGAGSTLTISIVGAGLAWTDEAISFAAATNNGYFCTAALTATLPAGPNQGDVIAIYCDTAGPVIIQANAGQMIRISTVISAAAGTATNTARGDALWLVYRAASTTWDAIPAPVGNWNVV